MLTNQKFLRISTVISLASVAVGPYLVGTSCAPPPAPGGPGDPVDSVVQSAEAMIEAGRQTFRFDTFGDEAFWGGQLRLHEAIAGSALGGVGTGISANAALGLGLKVDVESLSAELRRDLENGSINLNNSAATVELLRLNAVVGMTGFFDEAGTLRSVGIQCALCHSTVDDSLTPGVGSRLDGWANRDLNVGAIIAAAPNLEPLTTLLGTDDATVKAVLGAWGPGKFDAELVLDGKGFQPDGTSGATLIPPAFGLAGVNLHTWTGWGSVTHWNAFVAVIEMHGQGTFFDPRLNDVDRWPIAAANNFGNIRSNPDRVTPKLADLHFYQLALKAPVPPAASFDAAAAERGKAVFEGQAGCARCHVPPLYTEPGWNLHTPEEIGVNPFQANRAPDRRYRTAPLRGLWTHQKGGFYHDGRFATLADVVSHYDQLFGLQLDSAARSDLVEFLKSL